MSSTNGSAVSSQHRTLSEAESKALLAPFGVPFPAEESCDNPDAAGRAAEALGVPVALKLCGDNVAHKTERGLVRLNVMGKAAAISAASELFAAAVPEDGPVSVLVAPMIGGHRELICGAIRDPQFGPLVMLGVGGIMTEVLGDVAFAPAPIDRARALRLISSLKTQRLLDEFRGEAAVDRDSLADAVVAVGEVLAARRDVASIDLNPLKFVDGRPVAVDALVELLQPESLDRSESPVSVDRRADTPLDLGRFAALFDPKGVIVAGASSHPGKFGFVTLHNLIAGGFQGQLFATKLDAEPVLGRPTFASIDEIPKGAADLVVVCTPKGAVHDVLRAAAAKGVTAAFVTTAGYGESDELGRTEQQELVALCEELGILLAGPNGQGVVSTPSNLCAQIVAPNPPPGPISVVSQSGNLVSAFLNHARFSGVGIARAMSAGNAAAVGVIDLLEFFDTDPHTAVSIAYVEGISDGRSFYERLERIAPQKPIVVVKGGATAAGARAAASHTGSLATDDSVVDGVIAQAGAIRAPSVEAAFEAAASFATQPPMRVAVDVGAVLVLTTVGGWGVLASDAIARSKYLRLATLSEELRLAIDEQLPPRWSKNNPVDMAGGETRDSVPNIMALAAADPGVDAVLFLGLGIQSNQARLMREGGMYPDFGMDRIVAFHERQDRRYAEAAREVAESLGKPVLLATELAATDPENPGPAAVREFGQLCFPSAERAVAALDVLAGRARFLSTLVPGSDSTEAVR